MGNEGCDSEEYRRRGRILKKSASFMGIRSARVDVGPASKIDVQSVINGQYLSELENSQYFVSADPFGGVQSLSSQESLQERKSGMSFKALSTNKSVGECVNDLPEVLISGNVTGFELVNETGVAIGFGPGGALGGVVENVDFNLKNMRMSLDLNTFQPLSGTPLKSQSVTGTKSDFGGGIGLNLGLISIDARGVFKEPVVDVIRNTLFRGLFKLGESLEEMGQDWSARVYKNNDSHIMINAGFRHGLKKGDTFYVSNMKYFWDGKPCESRLDKQVNLHDEDNAIAKVIIDTEPSADLSVARVFESNGVDIQEGARVYMYYLKGSKNPEDDPMPDAPNPEEWVPKL
jgi:hypothetical protein